jgi:hypothetical protein
MCRRAIVIRRFGLAAAFTAWRCYRCRQNAVTLRKDPVCPSLDATSDRHQKTVHQPTRRHLG